MIWAIRSKPFCAANRDTMPITGTLESALVTPKACSKSCLHFCLPLRSCGEYFVTANLSVCGLHRSEEHTSELQSLRHLVCRLLLEKKKKRLNNAHNHSDSSTGSKHAVQHVGR